jgi:hypothetical protein
MKLSRSAARDHSFFPNLQKKKNKSQLRKGHRKKCIAAWHVPEVRTKLRASSVSVARQVNSREPSVTLFVSQRLPLQQGEVERACSLPLRLLFRDS